MDFPNVDDVQKHIEAVTDKEMRYCLETCFLYAGRISEVVGKVYPSDKDKTSARGPTGKDVKIEHYILGPINEEAAVFDVRTAKREGIVRKIALPLNYEPWAKQLYDYFQTFDPEDPVFPFYQQNVRRYVKENKVFGKLTYPILEYNRRHEKVPNHDRKFTLHALRHVRATDLVENYEFDPIDLAIYGGWLPETTTRHASSGGILTRVMRRYMHTQWKKYFVKLLR